MKLFTCSSCGNVLFFENTLCQRCEHRLAYLPGLNVLSALEPVRGPAEVPPERAEFVALSPDARSGRYRLCGNYVQYDVCNWAISVESDNSLCQSCALNDVIPALESVDATQAWARLEMAKRRLLYSLIGLGLPIEPRSPGDGRGLAFSFKSSSATEQVFTGHSNGLITINVAEADDPFREKTRQAMGEPYRTLLGHFRHEIGHYYWDLLIRDRRCLDPFRTLFGDETADYADAQTRHYEAGPPSDWTDTFVSAYASMHPWEDWAETFAHYLHIVDTLETARAYGLALTPLASGAPLPRMTARRLCFDDFDDLIAAWFPLTNALNSLNRSMGLGDAYPFILSGPAIAKLRFVHDVVERAGSGRAAA